MEPTPIQETVVSKTYHDEESVPGVELQNYVKRTPSDDGTYVVVVTHAERIEMIPQPLTPEELAQKREEEKFVLKIVGGMVAGFLGFMGLIAYLDSKEQKKHHVAVEHDLSDIEV